MMMKAQYIDSIQGKFEIDIPFAKIKSDEPLAFAKYIREYVSEQRRGDRPLNDWAAKTITAQTQITRRMLSIDPNWKSNDEDEHTDLMRSIRQHKLHSKVQASKIRRNGPSRNQILSKRKNREKFGIPIPNTTAEALQLDREVGDTKWGDAIAKEMGNLDRLQVFKYHDPSTEFNSSEGWQKAPLRMIFDIKSEDRRYKARLVAAGHKVDSTGYNRFSTAPRRGHLILSRRVLGYLKKFPKKGIVMDPSPPITTEDPRSPTEHFEKFGYQYQDFKEEIDPKFPSQIIP